MAVAIGATGPGNPNGDAGTIDIIGIVDVGPGRTTLGAAPPGEGIVALNFLKLAHNDADLLVTLIHELKHAESAFPTSSADIADLDPNLTSSEIRVISVCNHASIYASAALTIANVCNVGMSCALLADYCHSYATEYRRGQSYAAECAQLANELAGTSTSTLVATAILTAGSFYGDVSPEDIQSFSMCCHFASECP